MYGYESCTIKKAEHGRIDAFKLWCWRRLLRVPWRDSKEIKPVNPKGNQPWIFIGRTVAEAETSILWLPNSKSWLIGKDPNAGKDWRQEEKKPAEDEMVGWHHGLNGHEPEQRMGRTGMPGVLPSMGSQRVRHGSAAKQNNKSLHIYNSAYDTRCPECEGTGTLIHCWGESKMSHPHRKTVNNFLESSTIMIWFSRSNPRYLQEKIKCMRIYLYMNIHSSFIYNSPRLETIQMSLNK